MINPPRDGFAAAKTATQRNPLKGGHLSAARALAYTLMLGPGSDRLSDLALVWELRLTRDEQASILSAAIAAADPADAVQILRAALSDLADAASGDVPPLFPDRHPDPVNAPLGTRKRMLVALWRTLPDRDRRAFLSRVDAAGVFHRGAA